jgi:hypothetical protein
MAGLGAAIDANTSAGITPESIARERRRDAAAWEWDAITEWIAATPAHGVPGWKANAAALLIVLDHLTCKQEDRLASLARDIVRSKYN